MLHAAAYRYGTVSLSKKLQIVLWEYCPCGQASHLQIASAAELCRINIAVAGSEILKA